MNNKILALLVPLSAMVIADSFIGFYSGIIWVYGSILLCGILSENLKRFGNYKLQLGIMAIMSPILFLNVNDNYPKTFEGLLLCYTMGLPFFKNTMLSTLIYTGLFVVFIDFLKNTPFGLKLQKI